MRKLGLRAVSVALSCAAAAGLALASTGSAIAAASKKHQWIAYYQPRIVCGSTGCFEVPPGCRSEMRRVGHGVTAVVICDHRLQKAKGKT